jgi:hypothetical protein
VVLDRGPASAMPAAKDDIQIPGKIPYLVIIIDELVDLIQTSVSRSRERDSAHHANGPRGCVHLIVATL